MEHNLKDLTDKLYNVDKTLEPLELLDIIEYIDKMTKELQQRKQEYQQNELTKDCPPLIPIDEILGEKQK